MRHPVVFLKNSEEVVKIWGNIIYFNKLNLCTYLDGSVNGAHTVRYAKSMAHGGRGRGDITSGLGAEKEKFPSKVHNINLVIQNFLLFYYYWH